MRVLLVVHGFPPVSQGGTEIYADAHARTLRDRFGDEVFVLTREQDPSRPEYSTRTTTRAGIRIVWINSTPWPGEIAEHPIVSTTYTCSEPILISI